VTKRKLAIKSLTAFLIAFVLLLTSFNTSVVMADEPPEFFVHVDLNGGNMAGLLTLGPVPANSSLASQGIQLGTPTLNGFEFDGWSGGFTSATTITGDVWITAQWRQVTQPTVRVTFQPGFTGTGAFTSFTLTTAQSSTLGAQFPPDPQRTGHTFNGWRISGGTSNLDQNTQVHGDLTVTAQWTQNQPTTVTVTFNLGGGTIDNSTANHSRTVNTGQSITAGNMPPNPVRPGFTFAGWNGWAFTGTTQVNSNITVTAHWTANPPATVTFSLAGGNMSGGAANLSRTVNQGQSINTAATTINMPPNPTRTGFTFNGWQITSGGSGAFNVNTVISSNITVTAQWTSAQATVSFNLAGGSMSGGAANLSRTVNVGQSINASSVNMPPNPTRTGFTFNGWQITSGGSGTFNVNTIINSNLTVTAQWTSSNQATVTFNLAGGNISGSTTEQTRTVNIGQSINNASGVSMPANPTRSGYTFNRWEMSNGNTFTGTTTVNSNITVTAQWTSGNQATVTFNLAGGTIGNNTSNQTRTVNIGQSINNASGVSMPTNPTRQGFTFAGWEMSNGNTFTGTTVVNNSMTVTALWTSGNQATVTFNLGGGNINNSTSNQTRNANIGQSINNTSGVSMPQNPTRQGFTFAGWETTNGNTFTGTTIVNNSMTVTALWASNNQSIVTFNLGGGAINDCTSSQTRIVNNNQSINNTSSVSMPQNPTRQGFIFNGWEMANGNTFTGATTVNSNITVTAQWTSNQQATVTFNLGGGMIGNSTANQTRYVNTGQSINSTSGVSMPQNPTRQGFAFNGWQMTNGQEFNANTVINNSFTVTAQWVSVNVSTPAPLVNQVITLNDRGVITVGGNTISLPQDLGRFHINSNGVSVLPARAVLSVLFGADPYDPHLFIWHPDISTFAIDPQGHNIRIQVGNQTMHVGGAPRTILSGQGATAFPYAAYVDRSDSRLYVPVRAIAESVGFTVEWNAATSTVTLIPPGAASGEVIQWNQPTIIPSP